jgi:hypothetical protein
VPSGKPFNTHPAKTYDVFAAAGSSVKKRFYRFLIKNSIISLPTEPRKVKIMRARAARYFRRSRF